MNVARRVHELDKQPGPSAEAAGCAFGYDANGGALNGRAPVVYSAQELAQRPRQSQRKVFSWLTARRGCQRLYGRIHRLTIRQVTGAR